MGHLRVHYSHQKNKKPLTKTAFMTKLQTAIATTSLDQTIFSGHSFQSSATTAASQASLPDSTIQTLGRYSAAFLTYIHNTCQDLAILTLNLM